MTTGKGDMKGLTFVLARMGYRVGDICSMRDVRLEIQRFEGHIIHERFCTVKNFRNIHVQCIPCEL